MASSLPPARLPARRPATIGAPVRAPHPPRAVGEDWSKPSAKYGGFKYDFANSRWIRVEKGNANAAKYSDDMWKEGGGAVVTPKTGGSYVVWPVVHAALTARGLKSVSTAAALAEAERGRAVIVDCRPRYQWERERVAGSINVPLYRPVEGKGGWDAVKRAVMAVGLAMTATERNPAFGDDAAAALGGNKRRRVIVYCGLGGTLTVGVPPWAPDRKKSFKDDPERAFGRESRSLKACYELLELGWKDVVHMEGGLPQWRYDGLPVERGAP